LKSGHGSTGHCHLTGITSGPPGGIGGNNAAVPLPATFPLLVGGIGLMGSTSKRRGKA